jgi:hypothetical protein
VPQKEHALRTVALLRTFLIDWTTAGCLGPLS